MRRPASRGLARASPASRTPVPPPGRNGLSSGCTRRRAYSTPVPAIPNILCPENTAKSQPSWPTSTGMCPALWVQSKHSRTAGPSRPRSSSSVLSAPNTWCTWVTVISLVRGVTLAAMSAVSASPAAVTPYGTSVIRRPKPASTSRRRTHGYTFELWSSGLYRISSPSARLARPQDSAIAFSPAVAPGVNTISSALAAPRNRAACARTSAIRRAPRADHG